MLRDFPGEQILKAPHTWGTFTVGSWPYPFLKDAIAVSLNLFSWCEQRRLIIIQNHVGECSTSLGSLNSIILRFSQTCCQVLKLICIRFSYVTLNLIFIGTIFTAILLWYSVVSIFFIKFSLLLAEFQAIDRKRVTVVFITFNSENRPKCWNYIKFVILGK